jgi:hypothetical protein
MLGEYDWPNDKVMPIGNVTGTCTYQGSKPNPASSTRIEIQPEKRVRVNDDINDDGYIVGPELGDDLFGAISFQASNSSSRTGTYIVPFSSWQHGTHSEKQLSKWYSDMAYLADHRPTLDQSIAFWERLNRDTNVILRKFVDEKADRHETLQIDSTLRMRSHNCRDPKTAGIEFHWFPKSVLK